MAGPDDCAEHSFIRERTAANPRNASMQMLVDVMMTGWDSCEFKEIE
jgi:hypothetical protein